MFLFAETAADATSTNPAMALLTTALPFILIIAVVYFFMIRPQRKQEKEANAMRNSLSVGDEVTTIGGIIGRVVNVKEDTFILETTKERTRIRFERSAIKRIDRKVDAPEEPKPTEELPDSDGTTSESEAKEENK